MLIDGINDHSLRTMAALLPPFMVEQFVDHMSKASMAMGSFEKKPTESNKTGEKQANNCRNCGKQGHHHKECKNSVTTCFYCKKKGHRSFECPDLKRKNPQAATSQSTVTTKNKDDLTASTVVVSEPDTEVPREPVFNSCSRSTEFSGHIDK